MNKKIKASSLLNSTKTFNSIINHLSSNGDHHQVLSTFSSMLADKAPPDAFTFPGLLKACTSLQLFSFGLSIHQQVFVSGFSSDPYVSSSLINFYSKYRIPSEARKVFDRMRERDLVHWTAMIGCYSRAGDVDEAFSLVNEMRHQEIGPGSVTFLEMLCGVSETTQLQCLHGFAVIHGFICDIASVNSLLNVYCKRGQVEDAKILFERMEHRDAVSWNSMISGYAHTGNMTEISKLLCRMRDGGLRPNQQTFVTAVTVNGVTGSLEMGRILHGQILKTGFDKDMHLRTTLLTMYLKCGEVEASFQIFQSILDKDVVCWTAMISGLVQIEDAEKALLVFAELLKSGLDPSSEAITSVLAACAQLGSFSLGASVHGYVLRRGYFLDTPTLNSLITMYAKCGKLNLSLIVFERMNERDLVSWNAIISAHAQNGDLYDALLFLAEMRTKYLHRLDSLTVVSLLQTCASIGALHVGKLIHSIMIRSCLRRCIMVDTTLVDMYLKCGYLEMAERCFNSISEKDFVSWGALITGYGFHGKGKTALRIYYEFLRSGMEPNHVIFLAVLSSCSHNGMIEQGLNIFSSMVRDFGVEPNLEHLACVVDLLCRAKRVEDAYKFYEENFSRPSIDVLGIILDACHASENMETMDIIAKDMFELKPENAGDYVRLAQSFAALKRWDGVGEAWNQMRAMGLKKLPGWSFIERNGKITTFFMDHSSHPNSEMLSVLKVISKEMRPSNQMIPSS